MRKKPKGRKYRNLVVRGGTVYFEKVIDGRRERVTLGTSDWDVAASLRETCEQELVRQRRRDAGGTFDQFADEYLRIGMTDLAPTTQDDRWGLLGPEKLIRERFEGVPVKEIKSADLQRFWDECVTARSRAEKTGRHYIDAVSVVLQFAMDRGAVEVNPVDDFRRSRFRRRNTKKARARAEDTRHPIEDPRDVRALAKAAEEYGRAVEGGTTKAGKLRSLRDNEIEVRRQAYVATILMLDAGLRLGEALALRWGDCKFEPGDGGAPYLVVAQSRSRGKHLGVPKSGRSREVEMSQRLKEILRHWQATGGGLGDDRLIFATIDAANYRHRAWAWITKRAKLPKGHTPKDLRSTFASHLFSAGFPRDYIAEQLGHAEGDIRVIRKHYARRLSGRGYVAPPHVPEGRCPADFLATGREKSPQKSPQSLSH